MRLPSLRSFKLAGPTGDGQHAYVNDNGAFIGTGVPLLERNASGEWCPRDRQSLDALLAEGYGAPVDLDWRMVQLRYVAQALNKGDLSLACISLVRMELPPLPSEDHALRMAKADGLIKDNASRQGEPRLPKGDPHGGEWTRASAQGGHVLYENDAGSSEVRRGGTRAWRNNNPGNLAPGDIANAHGAIGRAGGRAIFPNEAAGVAAQRALLNHYGDKTVDQMVHAWAPPNENNTARYQSLVREWTGLKGSEKIHDLTPQQFDSVAAAQRRMEGWHVGTVDRKK